METRSSENNKGKALLILSMIIFGTIGVFRKYISMPSSVLAASRGLIGTVFLILVAVIRKEKLSWQEIRRNLSYLIISGGLIGFNWILLFEAYRYTTVATATLCYYLAPVFVILFSPFILKEKLTTKKLICVAFSLMGMVLVSGIIKQENAATGEMKGIAFGIGAAILYASVILLNKKIQQISVYSKTIIQLGAAAVVILPYAFIEGDFSQLHLGPRNLVLLIVVGVIHTGIAYALYFSSMKDVKAQSIALFSYIDPVVAIMLSAVVLRENIGVEEVVGGILILGSTMMSEWMDR